MKRTSDAHTSHIKRDSAFFFLQWTVGVPMAKYSLGSLILNQETPITEAAWQREQRGLFFSEVRKLGKLSTIKKSSRFPTSTLCIDREKQSSWPGTCEEGCPNNKGWLSFEKHACTSCHISEERPLKAWAKEGRSPGKMLEEPGTSVLARKVEAIVVIDTRPRFFADSPQDVVEWAIH